MNSHYVKQANVMLYILLDIQFNPLTAGVAYIRVFIFLLAH